MKETKGIRSRQEILDQAKQICNQEGIGVTLSDMAKKMGITQGKITYHFPTKDQLFLALVEEFEAKRKQLLLTFKMETEGFDSAFKRMNASMDLQHDYRCVHRFLLSNAQYRGEYYSFFKHLANEVRELVSYLIIAFVSAGSLEKRVLQPDNMNILFFQLATLFRSWVVTLELYDQNKSYEEIKPVYLKGIISCFYLYATEKGKKELKSVGVPA